MQYNSSRESTFYGYACRRQPGPAAQCDYLISVVVVLLTLIVQGLTLPWMIRVLQPMEEAPEATAAIGHTTKE